MTFCQHWHDSEVTLVIRKTFLKPKFHLNFHKKKIYGIGGERLNLFLVQCNGQLLRSPENGRINCPDLNTWIAEAGERCRLECDSGYTPSIERVSTLLLSAIRAIRTNSIREK